jgi:hypothetical protein
MAVAAVVELKICQSSSLPSVKGSGIKRWPQAIPWDLRGGHESVKALFGNAGKTEKGIEASQNVGSF